MSVCCWGSQPRQKSGNAPQHHQVGGVEDIEAVLQTLAAGLAVVQGDEGQGQEAEALDVRKQAAGNTEQQKAAAEKGELDRAVGDLLKDSGGFPLLVVGDGGPHGDQHAPEAVVHVQDELHKAIHRRQRKEEATARTCTPRFGMCPRG